MKDFIFTDPSESTAKVIFRTDLIGATNNNFLVMKVSGLADADVKSHQTKKRALLAAFRDYKYYSKADFVAFATLWGLDLVMQDANGDNQVILLDYNSDAGASSW